MSNETKIRIVVDETPAIVAKLDQIAESEGVSRADMLRRAIRAYIFSFTAVPTFDTQPKYETESTKEGSL